MITTAAMGLRYHLIAEVLDVFDDGGEACLLVQGELHVTRGKIHINVVGPALLDHPGHPQCAIRAGHTLHTQHYFLARFLHSLRSAGQMV